MVVLEVSRPSCFAIMAEAIAATPAVLSPPPASNVRVWFPDDRPASATDYVSGVARAAGVTM